MDKSKQQERVDEGASYLRTLIDWEGADLKRIYEPITDQIAYVFSIILVVIFGYLAWKKLLEWHEKSKRPHIQYKVLKPPSTVLAGESDPANKKKRICAVIGGTGFLGSHVVNELVRRGDYYVYVFGRTFRPERTNPDADCLIQVDLLDFDGLVNALQGVESIINAAAVLPNVFMDADEAWRKNKIGQENVLHAAKKAGVKNIVFVSGMRPKGKLTDPVMKAFINIMYRSENNVLKENGIDGLSTCAVAPGNIIGLNSPFVDMLTSGQVTSLPMSDSLPVSFSPVEYVAKALVNAENKLASGDQEVCGNVFPLRGEVMSWRQLFSLPGWPKKISESPKWIMSLILKINVFCVSVFRRAPFGADLSPGLMEIFSITEEDMKESACQRVYDVLGVGPPTPPMEQYVKEMVDKCKKLKLSNKDK